MRVVRGAASVAVVRVVEQSSVKRLFHVKRMFVAGACSCYGIEAPDLARFYES